MTMRIRNGIEVIKEAEDRTTEGIIKRRIQIGEK